MRVYLHSEKPVDERAKAVLAAAKERAGITETLQFMPLPEKPFRNIPCLSLGKLTQGTLGRVIQAPSVGALVTKADSLTRMTDAFKLLVNDIDLGEMSYVVEDRVDWLCTFLNTQQRKQVSFDIETSGDVKFDKPSYDQVISVAMWGGANQVMVIPEHVLRDPRVQSALDLFVRNNYIITVNGKFDLSYFAEGAQNFFDVMLAHYALFPAGSTHGLKDLADQYFGSGDWDAANEEFTPAKTYKVAGTGEDGVWWSARKYSKGSGYERIPRSILYKYNAYDVFYTWHLYKLMLSYLEEDVDSRRVFDFLMELSNEVFSGTERRGIRLNVTYLEELEVMYQSDLKEAEQALSETCGYALNPRSPQQVKKWLVDNGVRTKSTDKATIQRVYENPRTPEHIREFCERLTECRKISKSLNTYITGYLKQCHGDFAFPGYKLHAASTGRLGGAGASMLTIPRDKKLKRMVLPSRDTDVVVTADLSQAELRVMALESNDPWLIAAFQPGAGDFFDLLLSQAIPEHDWHYLHYETKDKEEIAFYNEMRARMKGVVYGVSFGRGVPAIALSLKITHELAQQLVDGFVRPGSAFAEWRDMIEEKAKRGKEINTKFGRHFQSEIITEKNEHEVVNSALSFTSQSTANDICLLATLRLVPQLEQYDAHLMGTVHDAIYVSCPEEHAETVGRLIAVCLEEAGLETYGETVRFKAEAGSGPNMADIEEFALAA